MRAAICFYLSLYMTVYSTGMHVFGEQCGCVGSASALPCAYGDRWHAQSLAPLRP